MNMGKEEGKTKESHKSNKKGENFIFRPINEGDIIKEHINMT
jgi:hypothetical protein